MFCYKCGNQLLDEAVFCNKCGTKIFSGKAQQENADVTDAGFETKNTAAEPTEKKEVSNAVPQTQPSTQHTAVALAKKEEPNPTSTLPTQPSVMSDQTQNKSELQYQNNQNDFVQFVENYISRNTGYHSTEELFNSKISIRFAWLSYGIPFLLIVILGIVRSMNIGQVLLLAVLVSLIVGFCVSQLMASFRRNRLSMRSEVIFEEDIYIDDFKDFLNQNLHAQYPLFHQWEHLTWTGGMNANTLNELEKKYKQITLGAEFGSHSSILLAKATIGPYQLNLQSGKKSFSFTVTNIVAGWADLSFKKYIWSFKVIPVMQAAAEYYLKSRQIGSSSNNNIGQAPQAESVVSTQQVSSVSDSNISIAPAIAGAPTAKKKIKAPIIITAAVVLVIAAAVTAFMLWKNSYSYNDKKSDNPSIETPVSEGHYTDDTFIETPVVEGHYTVGFLKKFWGCTPEEIEEIFGEIQTDNVSSYGDNLNLEYSYDGIRFLFVGNHLSEIFVSPEILEQKGETLDKTSDEIEKFLGEPFEFTPNYFDENDSEKMISYDLRYILGDVSMSVGVNCELGKVNGVSLSSYSIHDLLGLASYFGSSFGFVTEQMPGAKYARFDSFVYETYARYDDMTLHFEGSDGGLISITDISPDIVSYHLKTLDKTRSEIINLIGEPTEELETAADHKMIYDFLDYGVTVEISMLNVNSKAESVSIYALDDENANSAVSTTEATDASITTSTPNNPQVADTSVTINGNTYDVQKTTTLYVKDTNLSESDIKNIGKLVNLTVLSLERCQIGDITPLTNLVHLTSLDLRSNNISDITSLSNLIHLTSLDLSFNNISYITSLSNLTNLTSLDLSSNNISDVTSLSSLTNLTSLDLSSNNISDITSLSNLTNLTSLDLGFNEISDNKAILHDLDGSLTENEKASLLAVIQDTVEQTGFSVGILISDDAGEIINAEDSGIYAEKYFQDIFGTDSNWIAFFVNHDIGGNWFITGGLCETVFNNEKLKWIGWDMEQNNDSLYKGLAAFCESVSFHAGI